MVIRIAQVALAAALAASLSCSRDAATQHRDVAPPHVGAAPAALRFDPAAVDTRADPCTDFYDYACGGWRATHRIPPDRTRWSRYGELEELNLQREHAIVDDATRAGAKGTPAQQRIAAFYGACMDEAALEQRGLAPLHDLLEGIDHMPDAAAALQLVAVLQLHGARPLFDAYVGPDPRDVRRTTVTIDRGFLGMPSPGDYSRDGEHAAALRAAYREHLVRVFRDLGGADADADADRVVHLETTLAAAALSPVDERDPDARYHAMTGAELDTHYPALGLTRLISWMGAPVQQQYVVAAPAWLDAVEAVVRAPDRAPLRAYLRATIARSFATVLPAALERERFEFEQRQARGARDIRPRWQRCLELVDGNIGEDVGRLFLARYFSDDTHDRVRAIVDRLLAAYRAELRDSAWLGADAKRAALAKLDHLLVVIGGSNRLRDLEGLEITRDDLFGDSWRARERRNRDELRLLSAPTDREQFFDSLPQEFDGFTAHEMLGVGFTAGFLQSPVFDPSIDDAVNYGGLGGVIGHELTHELDDEGRKYDVDGNLHPWWSPDDVSQYETRARCFADEYSRFHTEEGTPLDGKLTLGENLADNGGLRLAYDALRPVETGPKIDGHTPTQRFFLAWAQIRCENVTPEAERQQALSDEHSTGRARVDGVVSNMPEFARAFACKAGSPMAPEQRCRMW